MTAINDVVLIHLEDEPVSFARVENILPDAKKDWYHVRLLMLQVPLQVVTWILKDDYINGHDFHMNGKKMKLTKVESPVEEIPRPATEDKADGKTSEDVGAQKKQGELISFSDFKKNRDSDDAG